MDILVILLIVVVILLLILLIAAFIFQLYTRKSTKTVIIINRKNENLSDADLSHNVCAIPVTSTNKKAIIELSKEQERRRNDKIGSDDFRVISVPGYIPSVSASDKDCWMLYNPLGKDHAKRSFSPDPGLHRLSQVSIGTALPVPKEDGRLSSAQVRELQLMDVGALPRDIASELEEREKRKKDRQRWFY